MNFLDKIERKFHKYSIPNLTIILIVGQAIVFFLDYSKMLTLDKFILIGDKVYNGEFWRLISFLFIPIPSSIIFVIFVWYIYYLYGTALENAWGTFKYNIYIFLSFIFTIAISLVIKDKEITNTFLYLSIFLAFAYLYPDFQLYIFLIIPIKIKWIALFSWLSYLYILVFGTMINKILLLVSLGNFFLFFGKDIFLKIKHGNWKMKNQFNGIINKSQPRHKCVICGVTDKDDREKEFRYCDGCDDKCYCMEHLKTHICEK